MTLRFLCYVAPGRIERGRERNRIEEGTEQTLLNLRYLPIICVFLLGGGWWEEVKVKYV